jgi:hypothetical protein
LDTFYVGKLKGVGKVWQITGCDGASSYGFAQLVIGEVTARAVLAFLTTLVRPGYRKAGWSLKRVLVDNGKDSREPSPRGVRSWVSRSRARSRGHAWTNVFVERLQKTMLHEHCGWPSGDNTSRAAEPSRSRSIAFCSSITTNDRIMGTG